MNDTVKKCFCALFVLALTGPAAVASDESEGQRLSSTTAVDPKEEEQESPAEILEETIVVTATRGERLIDEVPVSMTVLSQEDIENSPATKIDEILRTVPGLVLPPTSGNIHFPDTSRASMRGVPGRSTLVMIDGIPLNDPFRGYIQWNKVALNTIERIEVVRGASASLFGNYSIGGTINLLTRAVTTNGFDLRGSYGTDNTGQANLRFNHVTGETTSLSLSYNLLDTDGYIRAIPEVRGDIDISNWAKFQNFQLRTDYEPSPLFRATARVNYLDDERSQGTPQAFNGRDILDVAGNGHYAIGTDGDLAFSVFLQDQEMVQQNVRLNDNRDRETVANLSITDIESIGASIQWSRSISAFTPHATFGLDISSIEAVENRDNFSGDTVSLSSTGGEKEIAGLFAAVSLMPRETVEVLLSGRIDYWKSLNGFEGSPSESTEHEVNTTTEFDPRVSVRFELSDRSAVRASIYRGFRAPEIRDLYRSSGARGQQQIANPNLEPEILTGAELGFISSTGRSRGEVNLFWNKLDDTVNTVVLEEGPTRIVQAQNIGEARSSGVEIIGQIQPTVHWSLNASYVFANTEVTENLANESLEGNQLDEIPEHSIRAAIRYRASNGVGVELRGRYQSKAYVDTTNVLALDSHTIFDLSAYYAVNDRLDLFLIGENLFDEDYVGEITADPRLGAPQQFHAGFRLHMP